MCKIEFHDSEFWKMKRSNGIELLYYVWEPCYIQGQLTLIF